MRKRLILTLIAVMILTQMIPTTVFALTEAGLTNQTTSVSHTIAASLGYYEVDIPSSINTNESEYLIPCAANVTISENQLLTIRIDSERTYTNGVLLLKNAYGESITAHLFRIDRDTGAETSINHIDNPIVATYASGESAGDYLRISPSYNDDARPGIYEGNIYFTISVETAEI